MNTQKRIGNIFIAMIVIFTILASKIADQAAKADASAQDDLVGPAASGAFGTLVVALPNGNVVVTDPLYDSASTADVGAVYLYNGVTRELISKITGNVANDKVGQGITVLKNGNYLIQSPSWGNGLAARAGAITLCDGNSGCTGTVSPANSLVGSSADDLVGYEIVELDNGNYVVLSDYWHNGSAVSAGAATWCSGSEGCVGPVSPENSLVGTSAEDFVGSHGVTALDSGNFLILSGLWDNGSAQNAGAVTWCSGISGCQGVVSSANSLVGEHSDDGTGMLVYSLASGKYLVSMSSWDNGSETNVGAVSFCAQLDGCDGPVLPSNSLIGSTAHDEVGIPRILANGNYVVSSPYWHLNGLERVGAVTWCSASTGCVGAVTAQNSLTGRFLNDAVGEGVATLKSGNYVVLSPHWNSTEEDLAAGAATWCDGEVGCTGVVSVTNSLVGTSGDNIGQGFTALQNGNYVVYSMTWNNGPEIAAGAVTFCHGEVGCTGVASATNSLVGTKAYDMVGSSVTALKDGSYVVNSPYWDQVVGTQVITDTGAVTWCNGTSGCVGAVSADNSLTGMLPDDTIAQEGTFMLSNGNYVISSPFWYNGPVKSAGAVTWCSATLGCPQVISTTNSLVGATTNDVVGISVITLPNGNYVVRSSSWDNGPIADAGGITICSGQGGCTGAVSAFNSLVGTTAQDRLGDDGSYTKNGGIQMLPDGNLIVKSIYWDNGAISNAGAITWVTRSGYMAGPITADNSVFGGVAGGGEKMNSAYNAATHQLVVGRPAENIVTFLHLPPNYQLYLPAVLKP